MINEAPTWWTSQDPRSCQVRHAPNAAPPCHGHDDCSKKSRRAQEAREAIFRKVRVRSSSVRALPFFRSESDRSVASLRCRGSVAHGSALPTTLLQCHNGRNGRDAYHYHHYAPPVLVIDFSLSPRFTNAPPFCFPLLQQKRHYGSCSRSLPFATNGIWLCCFC